MALVQGIWCPSAMPVIVHGVRSVFLKAYIQAGRFLRFIFAVRLFRLVKQMPQVQRWFELALKLA